MYASIHNSKVELTSVNLFDTFASITFQDEQGNQVSVFVDDLLAVSNLAREISRQCDTIAHAKSNEIIERVFSRK